MLIFSTLPGMTSLAHGNGTNGSSFCCFSDQWDQWRVGVGAKRQVGAHDGVQGAPITPFRAILGSSKYKIKANGTLSFANCTLSSYATEWDSVAGGMGEVAERPALDATECLIHWQSPYG